MPAAATRSPTRQWLTRGPTASTMPAQSTPGMSGRTGPRNGLLAGAQADIEHAIDGRGVHLDADFAGARHGIGNVLVAQNVGRTVFVDDDGFHFRNFMWTAAVAPACRRRCEKRCGTE